MTDILLLCGGDGAESSVSMVSADFIEKNLKAVSGFNVLRAVIHNHQFQVNEDLWFFDAQGNFSCGAKRFNPECVVPCIHGIPGETGDIQSFLEILDIPYIGCTAETSRYCFNKITTKLYLSALGIPNTPYVMIPRPDEECRKRALEFFGSYGNVFVKAASQGSSVGCYHVTSKDDLWDEVLEAFKYSSEVILEKNIVHRELECAAYTYNNELVIAGPGEIIMPDNVFYTYEEKYSKDSGTKTTVEPQGLDPKDVARIRELACRVFTGLKLRDLSRIDFFLSEEDGVLVNEINTFPGMTPISMFPKLLEHHGDSMPKFLEQCVERAIAHKH